MVKVASQGLSRAKEIYRDRPQRAKELRAQGRKVMGYLCIYPVVEMMTGLDLVPYRIFGDMRETITKADTYLPTVVCPFLRSCLDLGLKGKYDFLDGVVFSHICDVGAQLPGLWNQFVQTPYSYFIDTPHTVHQAAQEHQKALMMNFQKSLEEFTGKKLTPAKLKAAIKAHNEQRALVRELYDLKKPDPPMISGAETIQVMAALMSLPVDEGTELVKQIIKEVKTRKNGPAKKSARLLVWGSIIHDISFIEMLESLDANVVMDDTCVGSRAFFSDVKVTDDPMDGLAYRYLVELKCPRTFRERVFGETKKDYMADLQSRFQYVGDYAKDWKASGVIVQSVRYCDGHGYEAPGLRDYLTSIGTPSIYLEHDYSEGSMAPLRTRAQGFLEIIS